MDLPNAPRAAPPQVVAWRRDDPRRRLWGPVTTAVAWELVLQGVRVRHPVLAEVREHALWMVPAEAPLAEAEVRAAAAARDWLARVAGTCAPFVRDPDLDIVPSAHWREAVHDRGDTVRDTLFRLHYADGVPLDQVEARTRIDGPLLRGAREALREATRVVVADDGISLEGWEPARVDRLISRIAVASGDGCPGPTGLATDAGRAHAEGCPRCTRVLRLLREGVISPTDLFPPEGGPALAEATTDLALVQVHPDARGQLRALTALFDARPVGSDLLAVDVGAHPGFEATMRELAERGRPAASALRVARRVVRSHWARKAIVGPGVLDLQRELSLLGWGEVRGLDVLPEVVPPAPSAVRWWSGAALLGLVAVAAGVYVSLPGEVGPSAAVEAAAQAGAVVFDTDDSAYVDVIALRSGSATVVFHSVSPADKGAVATGDGRYKVVADADQFLIVASSRPLEDLPLVVQAVPSGTDASMLKTRVRERYPAAGLELVTTPR